MGYSRRGHFGSSQNDGVNQPVGSDDLRLLLDHLGLAKVHLLSAAYGGFFATDFTLSFPDRVHSLTVVSSFISPYYQARTIGLRPEPFNSMPADFKELSPSYRATNPDGVAAWREIVSRSLLPGSSILHQMANEVNPERLSDLRARTLLITGSSDLYVPPPTMLQMAAQIPRASTLVFPTVGHAANWETPRLFNAALLKHLSPRRRASATG